jgi:ARID/BRIGHT DNA binding domain
MNRDSFPEAVLNGQQLDLFALYREVATRGGFKCAAQMAHLCIASTAHISCPVHKRLHCLIVELLLCLFSFTRDLSYCSVGRERDVRSRDSRQSRDTRLDLLRRLGNGINWKSQVFTQMRNWTKVNNMTGVGNALKRHYQVRCPRRQQCRAQDQPPSCRRTRAQLQSPQMQVFSTCGHAC